MRILHVNKFLYRRGGAESYMLDVADLQREAGHEVALWGMQHPENMRLPLQDTFPEHVEFEPPPAGVRARAQLLAHMVHSGSARRGMAQAVQRFRPDVVHLHNIYHQLSPSVLAPLREAGVPAVMTLHDYKLACPTYQLMDGSGRPCMSCVSGGLHHAALRRCGGSAAAGAAAALEVGLHRRFDAYGHISRFLCPSRFLADVVRAAGVYPDRLAVLHNPIDPRGLLQREHSRRSVTFVGRLSHEKGVDVLVRAVPHLAADVAVDIAGTGPAEASLRQLADQVAPGRITWHGRLDREQVGLLLASSGVFTVPSRWYENQPIAVLEAFAAAVPVVASRMGGLAELVEDGVTGLLVGPEDPLALARGLTEVLADPIRNEALGHAARRRALEQHEPLAHVRELGGHYSEVQAHQPTRSDTA